MVAGGLWICLWRTRWRRWGLVPVAAGALWALADAGARPARHRRRPPPRLAHAPTASSPCCAPRAGDYVRDTLAEASGAEPDFLDLESPARRRLQRAICAPPTSTAAAGAGACSPPAPAISSPGPRWSAPAPRPTSSSPTAACRAAATRAGCAPTALSCAAPAASPITLGDRPRVATVAERVGRHPWARPAEPAGQAAAALGRARCANCSLGISAPRGWRRSTSSWYGLASSARRSRG